MKTKICNKCNLTLSIDMFRLYSTKYKDKRFYYYMSSCKECERERNNKYNNSTIGKNRCYKYRATHKGKLNGRRCSKRHQLKYPEKHKTQSKRMRDELRDTYINSLCKHMNIIPSNDIIDLKRLQLKIYRECQNLQKLNQVL